MFKNIPSRIFLLFCLFNSFIAYSQMSLTVGPDLPHKKGVHLFKVLGKINNDVYSIWIDPNGKGGNDEYFIEKYDLTTLQQEYSVAVDMNNDKGDNTTITDVFLLNNKIIFLSGDESLKYYTFYAQVHSLDGTVEKPMFVLAKEDNLGGMRFNGFYNSRTETIMLSIHRDGKALQINDRFQVFSANDFSMLKEKSFPTYTEGEEDHNYSGFVCEKDGTFHYMHIETQLKEDNKRVFKSKLYFCYTAPDRNEQEVRIGQDGETFFGISQGYLKQQNAYIVAGIKARDREYYSFVCTIDAKTGDIVKYMELQMKMHDSDKMEWEFHNQGSHNLRFSDHELAYSNGIVWVVGEQYFIDLDHVTGYFFDLAAAHFNLEDNTSGWINLPKREHLKARYTLISPTNYIFMKNAKLEVLYMDSEANLKALQNQNYKASDLELVVEHDNSTLVLAEIDTTNKIVRKTASSDAAKTFHLHCRTAPNKARIMYENLLCLELSDNSMLVFLEDNNKGKWAILSNF